MGEIIACFCHSARRLWSRAAPDRGWALNRLWSSLYRAKYFNDCAGLVVAQAPARGAVGRCAAARKRASIPRIGTRTRTTPPGQFKPGLQTIISLVADSVTSG